MGVRQAARLRADGNACCPAVTHAARSAEGATGVHFPPGTDPQGPRTDTADHMALRGRARPTHVPA
jgi:hypothetical protein